MHKVRDAPGGFRVRRLIIHRVHPVDEVQLLVGRQSRSREVARTDDRRIRPQPIIPVVRPDPILMEQVRLGVQKPLRERPHPHFVFAQKRDQRFHQLERFLIERHARQFGHHHRPGTQTDIGAGFRFLAQKQPQRADGGQLLLKKLEMRRR